MIYKLQIQKRGMWIEPRFIWDTMADAMDLTFPQIFGEWLRRQRGNLTQRQMAKILKMTQGNLSEIESGTSAKALTSTRIAQILAALEINAARMVIDLGLLANNIQADGIPMKDATISPRAEAKAKVLSESTKGRGAVTREPNKRGPR
jgi:transcriptional regulator with XRE-family HTH domain